VGASAGSYVPAGCAHITELGPQAQWFALAFVELLVVLIGAIVGLAVIVAISTTMSRRA
jgi:hypothetical protein